MKEGAKTKNLSGLVLEVSGCITRYVACSFFSCSNRGAPQPHRGLCVSVCMCVRMSKLFVHKILIDSPSFFDVSVSYGSSSGSTSQVDVCV